MNRNLIREILREEMASVNMDKKLLKEIDELGDLQRKISEIEAELKILKTQSKEIESKISPTILALRELGATTIQTAQHLVKVKRAGATSTRYSWKKIALFAISKLNGNCKKLVEQMMEDTATIVETSTSLSIELLDEGYSLNENRVLKFFRKLLGRITGYFNPINKLTRQFKKINKDLASNI